MTKNAIRIGGASGYWGDSAMAVPQLLAGGSLDYLVFDYLAEITMSILARARVRDPEAGYATDFVTAALAPNLGAIAAQGVRVISNAGGVNPVACGAAVRALVEKAGLTLKVAVITGDDLLPCAAELAQGGLTEMFTDEAFPPVDRIASLNVYLGAFPIAAALDAGADIVITGRCVDSAVTLGACIHAFGWSREDYDRLASGSLAGHVLECGPQATGGNFTDWECVAAGIAEIGYPIAEITPDGDFTVSKPAGTGGCVSVGTVSEQMLYEIGDPQDYALPDVSCDFSQVTIMPAGPDQVFVSGAHGAPPPEKYKASLTWQDGWRAGLYLSFYGLDAARKAQSFADAAIARAGAILGKLNAPPFSETSAEILGNECQFGTFGQSRDAREVVLKLAAKHADAAGAGLLLREAAGLGLASPPGLSGFQGGRPKPSPVIRLFSCLCPRPMVDVRIELDGKSLDYAEPPLANARAPNPVRPEPPAKPDTSSGSVRVPLIALAWGRSGDKGNHANIGIIARDPEFLAALWHGLSTDIVTERFAHFLEGPVERFYLPGSHAINFLLHDVLGGGGIASLRNDPQGKGYAQILLATPIEIPTLLAQRFNLTEAMA
ncbi:acyclic terpene utilization AtuA family protein [Maricaulis sp.]|uniref:acyclic terpene utilization AtuA family protein n=1 Tax=Maricaulis sp. TaxID=1486257 RepID=UPI003A93F650